MFDSSNSILLCFCLTERFCDASELEQCSSVESCVVEPIPATNSVNQHLNGTCHCLKDYERASNGECVRTANLGPGYVPLHGHPTSGITNIQQIFHLRFFQ